MTERLPRILALMGSGETSPTMVKVHRELLARLGPAPVPAVLLDTPFGFQRNAGELTSRAVNYFAESVGQTMGVASYRSAADASALEYETMLARLREARYVFAGPGSPSYALRQWSGSMVPAVLAEKLTGVGCVTFASAAALTLGIATLPVYEIYKVGADPAWLEGLDLLSHAGLCAAVIPHYNNAEGGTHDTRYCYLGEERLRVLEHELPPGAFVLGVDEHTACVIDIDARSATVVGLGCVTARRDGSSREFPAGSVVSIDELREGRSGRAAATSTAPVHVEHGASEPGSSPLMKAVERWSEEFDSAFSEGRAPACAEALLGLEADLHSWSADTLQSDENERARAVLRSMVVRLAELADRAGADPAELVRPFVEKMVEARHLAREEQRWNDADALRDELLALGVEVQDAPEGSTWRLLS